MPRITLYHGTAKVFASFDERFALRGSEPNSALGIHLTEHPALAADYAEMAARDAGAGKARVLVVEADVERVGVCDSATDYMGRDGDDPFEATRPRVDFVEARLRLQDEGFHAVATGEIGGDLDGCWAVFDPARLRIVATMTLDESYEAESSDVTAPDYVGIALFEDGVAPSLG